MMMFVGARVDNVRDGLQCEFLFGLGFGVRTFKLAASALTGTCQFASLKPLLFALPHLLSFVASLCGIQYGTAPAADTW